MKFFGNNATDDAVTVEELEDFFGQPEPEPDAQEREQQRLQRGREINRARYRKSVDYTQRCGFCGNASLGKVPGILPLEPAAVWLDRPGESLGRVQTAICRACANEYRSTPRNLHARGYDTVLQLSFVRALRRSPHKDAVAGLAENEFHASSLSEYSWLAAAWRARHNDEPDPGDGSAWSHL